MIWLLPLALNLLLQLPYAMHGRFHELDLLVVSGELVVLLTLLAARPRWGPRLFVAGWSGLMVYEIVRLVGNRLTGGDPLFFDLFFLLRHLGVLLMDLGAVYWALVPVAILVSLGASAAIIRRLVKPLQDALRGRSQRWWLVVWAIALLGTPLPTWLSPMRWSSVSFIENAAASWVAWRRTRATIQGEAYAHFEDIELTERPDVRLFIIESYGRLLADHPQSQELWAGWVTDLERALAEHEWKMVSGYSTAPVSGGRSWMADASFFLGQTIQHEADFRHITQNIDRAPSLPRFLDQQGYHTVLLAPKDRARPGVQLENHFNFQTTLFFEEMKYRGPAIGWGWIPDQYSLGRAHQDTLQHIEEPVFFSFHMVSSHAPWNEVPDLLSDWRAFDLYDGSDAPNEYNSNFAVTVQMRRFQRKPNGQIRRPTMGALDGFELAQYAEAVGYDLDVIEDHLLRTDPGGVVIIMGDHQPPFMVKDAQTFDVPIHILTRNPTFLKTFEEAGFVEGAIPAPGLAPVRHRDMFPLIVSALENCCTR
ncbi:MAG: hypothetical protein AAFV53_21335 [Myxococcota bacterium]